MVHVECEMDRGESMTILRALADAKRKAAAEGDKEELARIDKLLAKFGDQILKE